MKISKIRKKIQKVQDDKRFEHTLGVEYTAACLAMRYDVDIENARVAGILHDCAKTISDDKLIELCKKYDIPVSEVEYNSPYLLHGKVGSLIAKKKFKIESEDILNAIANHTTGRPNMSMLEKIIFVSDYIEPGRSSAKNLLVLRKLAFQDLDMCMIKIYEDTLDYLKKSHSSIDPKTQETYDYYIKEYIVNGN